MSVGNNWGYERNSVLIACIHLNGTSEGMLM